MPLTGEASPYGRTLHERAGRRGVRAEVRGVLLRSALRRRRERPRRAAPRADRAGLEPGDEVIVPAITFVATFEAVTQAGGRPVPVDVTESDYNLDPRLAATAITAHRAAAAGPPLRPDGGHAHPPRARLDARLRPSRGRLPGARRLSATASAPGAPARAAAFSFYPGKNLGAFGDAGALVTDDERLATSMRALREHGQRAKYRHELEGYTARLDTIQALVLLRKLPLLDGWNASGGRGRGYYGERSTASATLRLPPVAPGSEPVWHLYGVRTGGAGGLAAFLASAGIATGRHYPDPVHLTEAYAWLGGRGDPPRRGGARRSCLSLPIFPGITEAQLEAVVAPSGTSSTVADGPVNDAPYRLIDDVEFGENVVVHALHESLRLLDRRRHAHRPVRRDPARRRRSARAARSRATRSSATASRSATRCSSVTASSSSTTSGRARRPTGRSRRTTTGSCCGRSSSAARRSGRAAVVLGGVRSAPARSLARAPS